jgi:hypothetical protein
VEDAWLISKDIEGYLFRRKAQKGTPLPAEAESGVPF